MLSHGILFQAKQRTTCGAIAREKIIDGRWSSGIRRWSIIEEVVLLVRDVARVIVDCSGCGLL